MAVLNFGGYEHDDPGGTASSQDIHAWGGTDGDITIATTGAKHGGRCLSCPSGSFSGGFTEHRLPDRTALGWTAGVTRHVYQWLQATGQSATNPDILDMCDAIWVQFLSNSWTIRLTAASNSSAITLTQDQWHLAHVTYVQGGTCTLQIDGGTGVTASPFGGDGNSVQTGLGCGSDSNLNGTMKFDSWVLADAALDYDPAVYRMAPDGDGNYTGWTGAFGDVDEIASDGDTTYITTSSANTKESVTLESTTAAGVVGTIKAVKVQALVRDEGGASSMRVFLRTGGTDYNGNSIDPGSSYVNLGHVWETNPNTGVAWTAADLDGLEIGVENINAVAVRCTQLGLMVLTDGVAAAGGHPAIRRLGMTHHTRPVERGHAGVRVA